MKYRAYILLDRSGSMTTNWGETLPALNTFARGLKKKNKVTLIAFDDGEMKHVRTGMKSGEWSDITDEELLPRGMTPLFDAVGHLSTIIDKDKPKRATIMVITDGRENASRETNIFGAQSLVKRWEDLGYDVVFLGAGFNNATQSKTMGGAAGQTMQYDTNKSAQTMSIMSARATSYAGSGDVVDLTDKEREIAGGN